MVAARLQIIECLSRLRTSLFMAHGFQQLSGGFQLEVGSFVIARGAKGKT